MKDVCLLPKIATRKLHIISEDWEGEGEASTVRPHPNTNSK